ncbi:nicotinamide-nucleotide adenylyltransferase [Candidatus Peregrinibacteria bacterium]|nr:nicotinamide-nucleotide adenylyltransferase [Candidatus Peregrinibacteria bacterium]
MQSALFVGRFQPFHLGHLDVVKKILEKNERVIIVIGSAEKNFLPDNPFTAGERFQLIDEALKEAEIPAEKYCIIPVRNVNNYALWVNHINCYVPPYTHLFTGSKIVKACYEGKYTEIIQLKRVLKISATKVREAILKNKGWEKLVPPAVARLLKTWNAQTRLRDIKETMDYTKYNNEY